MAEKIDLKEARGNRAAEHLSEMTGRDWQFDPKQNQCFLKLEEGVDPVAFRDSVNAASTMDNTPGMCAFMPDKQLGGLTCIPANAFDMAKSKETDKAALTEAFKPENQQAQVDNWLARPEEERNPPVAPLQGDAYLSNDPRRHGADHGSQGIQGEDDERVKLLAMLAKLHEEGKLSDRAFAELAGALIEEMEGRGTREAAMRRFVEQQMENPGLLETVAVAVATTVGKIAEAMLETISDLIDRGRDTHAATRASDNYRAAPASADAQANGQMDRDSFIATVTEKMGEFVAGGSRSYKCDVQNNPDGMTDIILSDQVYPDRKMTFKARDIDQALDTFREIDRQREANQQALSGNSSIAASIGKTEMACLGNALEGIGDVLAGLQGVSLGASGVSNTTARAADNHPKQQRLMA